MNEKFEWLPTYSAPDIAPVEIYEGSIFSNGEQIINIKNWGVIHPGWGKTSGTAVIGDREKPIPDSIHITWLSAAENIFYTINTPLPVTVLEKLFKEGVVSIYNKEKTTYTELIIGFAPGGFVVVWLAGEKEQVAIATYMATPVTIPLEKVDEGDLYMFAANYTAQIMENITAAQQALLKTINLKTNYWQQYHKKQRWQPVFELPGKEIIEDITITCFNGEKEAHIDTELKNIIAAERALPKEMVVRWHEASGKGFGAEITIDETEIKEAFNKLGGTGNIILLLRISGNQISLVLKNNTHQYPLSKAVAEVYRVTK
jgi:Protein of unknown function (DUF2931)